MGPVRTSWRRRAAVAAAALAAALALGACGGEEARSPVEIRAEPEEDVAETLGFPFLATKNTTRIAGEDSADNAAGVARAVYPALGAGQRPDAVTLVHEDDILGGIAASTLVGPPIKAPILFTERDGLPDISADALDALRPRGSALAGRAKAFRVGDAAAPEGLEARTIAGEGPVALAAAIDDFASRLAGTPSESVVVAPTDDPRFAMPAAGWAAKSGDAVLYVTRDSVPPETRRAIARRERPSIYVLGPKSVISERVVTRLKRLGAVTRIAGDTPVESAIEFARFSDGEFGWGVRDPGHGLVIANAIRPLDAAAGSALSASGKYGPLLVLETPERIPSALENYLLDVQPGYRTDPVRGVYNHAWLMGDASAISLEVQGRVDRLTEIVAVEDEEAE